MLPALDQKLVSRTVLTSSLITVQQVKELVSGACQLLSWVVMAPALAMCL